MAAGCAIVATDMPDLKGVVEDAECGIIVPARDVAALEAAMATLLRNPSLAAELGASGRFAMEGRWSWQEMERRLVALYRSLGARTAA